MIYVSEEQLNQVEYLMEQSRNGFHVLFDHRDVSRIMKENFNGNFDDEAAYEVEHHIERLITEPTLAGMRRYLSELDRTTYEMVVRTYFNIVENNIYESLLSGAEVRH